MSLAFPCRKYAEAALNTIAVDPAFTDTKTKKTTITRNMQVRTLEGDLVYLDIEF